MKTIVIRPLTSELNADYLDFFDHRAFTDDNPNGPCYLDSLTDEMLYECPENCEHTTHLWIVNRNQPAANHGLERKTIIWHTDCFST